jgi:uncharacterized protein (TIGR02444 family)
MMTSALDIELNNALWRFVLSFYGRDKIAAACLTLQDRLAVDVNVLLFAIFAHAEGRIALNEDDIATLDALIREWRTEVIQPLRRVRSRMKSGPGPAPSAVTERLRSRIKGAELEAEQIELAVLHNWLERQKRPASLSPDADAPRIVARHFARQGAFTPEVEAALGTLSHAMGTASAAHAAQLS